MKDLAMGDGNLAFTKNKIYKLLRADMNFIILANNQSAPHEVTYTSSIKWAHYFKKMDIHDILNEL